MISLVEVKTRKQWLEFATFPTKLYKDNPHYVPAFVSDDADMANPKKNPNAKRSIVKAFLAYKDGEIAGRIAGIILLDSPLEEDKTTIRFSRYDVIDDIEVSKALFNAIEDMAKEHGMSAIHGPWDFNDTGREGMLTFGYDEDASWATLYNHAYYNDHMAQLGFVKESGWIEQELFVPGEDDPNYARYIKLGEYVKKKFKLRELCETMSVKQIIKKYGDSFFDCYNDGYKKLDMFVEIKDDVKKQILDQFEMLINKEFFSVLVDESDRVVAFTILTPAFGKIMKKHDGKTNLPFIFDVLKYLKKPDKLETTLGAVRSEFLKKGYNAPCCARMIQKINEHKIGRVCSLPTLETNTAVRAQWNAFESKIIKQRQTYIKNI